VVPTYFSCKKMVEVTFCESALRVYGQIRTCTIR
jgi:hypothetical protein